MSLILKMDIIVDIEKKHITSSVVISLSYCDTDETLLFYIAQELQSLPSFLEWETKPSWSVFSSTKKFKCKDYLSFLMQASELNYPKNVPKTENFQKTFISTHQQHQDPRFLEYFDQKEFTLPLRDLNDQTPVLNEEKLLKNIICQRDKNIYFCSFSQQFHLEDVHVHYKRFTVKLPLNLDINDIFNQLQITEKLPFGVFQGIVKSYQYFKVPETWLDIDAPGIVFKIKHNPSTEDFSTGVIIQEEDSMFCILDTAEFYKDVDAASLLTFLNQALHMQNLTLNDQSAILTYNILQEEFHDCYLSDLIMHQFSVMFYIDEFLKASKASNRLYIHLADETGAISLFQKYTQKPLQFNTEIGTPYITVRIRAENEFLAQRIRFLLNCLLGFYHHQAPSIRNFYRPFTKVKESHRVVRILNLEDVPLKIIAPDIFLSMYSRRCLNMPSVVLEKDIQNRPFMKFPMFGESQQRIYVCNHKKYKFPGLRVNELENRDLFPYVPCCYSKDQSLNPNSKLNKYLMKKPVKPKIKQSLGAILNLPGQLKKYFTFIDPLHDYILLSNPVDPFSFLTATWYALNKTKVPISIQEKILKLRPEICAQESFPTEFQTSLNPLNHIRLLETFLGISIFLFSRNGPLLPNFNRLYLKSFPAKKVVFLYVKATQHCFPITRTGASEIYFLNTSPVVKAAFSHVEKLSPHPFTNQSVFEYFNQFKIKGQILNADRHCIFFICEMNNSDVPIATEPQLPFPAPIITKISRLTTPDPIDGFFHNVKYIIHKTTVREIIIPFSPQARILTHFPITELKYGVPVKTKKEKFAYMDVHDTTFFYNFTSERQNTKALLRTLNLLIKSYPIQMDKKSIDSWLKTNSRFLPPLPRSDKNLLIQKLAFLINLRYQNNIQYQNLDVQLLDHQPHVLLSKFKAVLKPAPTYRTKSELKFLNINDSIFLNGKKFIRVPETSQILDQLPVVVYYSVTDKFYSLPNFTEVCYDFFKTYVNGKIFILKQMTQ